MSGNYGALPKAMLTKKRGSNLFQLGHFQLHSGSMSQFKIDCDALTDDDITAIARAILEDLDGLQFGKVIGIPRGGLRLAAALQPYVNHIFSHMTLIVDDVFTTGYSMEKMSDEVSGSRMGYVIFARGALPSWISAVFKTEMMK